MNVIEDPVAGTGSAWTDDGTQCEHRGLKHRADGTTRPVPSPPELTRILRRHLTDIGTGPGGRPATAGHQQTNRRAAYLHKHR